MHTHVSWKTWWERDHLEELGADGKMILKCVFEEQDVMVLFGSG
jgi:hypothetical protein